MAKKKSGKGKVDDLEFDDLGDLGDDLDFSDMEEMDFDRTPNSKGLAGELSKEAASGFAESLAKKAAKKSLPPEYEYHASELTDYADVGKEILTNSKSRIEKSMFRLGNEVQKILPFQSKILDNFLNKYREENEQHRQASEEAMREASMAGEINNIFDRQLDVQQALAARQEAKDQVKEKQEQVRTKMNLDILTSINNHISQSTAFTLQIGKDYYRKSLELQYKSYFVQADMLKTMRDYYKGFSVQFDNIAKNTGLPDFVKLTTMERASELVRNKAVDAVYSRLFERNKYVAGIKERAGKYVSGKLESALSGVDGVTDQLEMLNSTGDRSSVARLLMGVAASLGGSTLGEKVADKISPKIKDKIKDNETINSGASWLTLLAESPTTFFAEMRKRIAGKKEQYSGESTPGEMLGSKFFGALGDFANITKEDRKNFKITKHSVLDHNKPAIFTNKTEKAISEVIPMYLARILQQNSDLTQMYREVNKGRHSNPTSQELVFNYETRSLSSVGDLRSYMEDKVLAKKGSKERIEGISTSMIRSAKSTLDKDRKGNKNELSKINAKGADKLLASYINEANKRGQELTSENLITNGTSNEAMSDYISRTPGLKELLEALQKGSDSDNSRYSDIALKDVNSQYPIGALTELLAKTSEFARSKTINRIDTKTAISLARCFSTYVRETGDDIIPDNVMNGTVVAKFMLNTDYTPDVKRALGIFTSELRTIQNSTSKLTRTQLLVLFGILNNALRGGYEVDPKVFQDLYDYDPRLGKPGKLNEGNLIERKLDALSHDKEDYVTMADVRSITRMSKADVEQGRSEIFTKFLDSGFIKGATKFKEDLVASGGNPFKIVEASVNHAKSAANAIKSMSKEYYTKSTEALGQLSKEFDKFSEKTAKAAIGGLRSKLSRLDVTISELIAKETTASSESIKTLNDLKSNMSQVSSDPAMTKSIDREIKLTTAYYRDKLKVLEEIRKTISNINSRIDAVEKSSEGKTATDMAKEVKTIFMEGLEKLKGLLERAKVVESSESSAAA